jgi:hypothetical protein
LSELGDYCKIHGHCNVPMSYSENTKLARWVGSQKTNYRFHLEGKKSPMTLSRIQELEGLGFEWSYSKAAWEDRLSELANYRIIQGHCNVPANYSDNNKLATWVATQRMQYRLHREGKTSHITPFRIKELERLGFDWVICDTWDGRLSELSDYRKLHGHCNVPRNYSENRKLGKWICNQRSHYGLHVQGKKSSMTLSRIQALESLGFEWKPSISRRKEISKKPSLDDDATRNRERATEVPEHELTTTQTREAFSDREFRSNQVDVAFEPEESDWNGEVHLAYIPGRTEEI